MHTFKLATFAIILLCSYLPAKSQYGAYNAYMAFKQAKEDGNAGFFHRMSTGAGKFYVNNKVVFKYKKDNGRYSTLERDLTTASSIYFEDNYFIPLAGMGDKSTLTLTYGVFVGMMTLEADEITFDEGTKYKLEAPIGVAGVPISVDYKVGGEATLNKHDNTLFTIGLGLAPGIYENFNDENPMPFRMIPFVKAEFGFFWGIAFKLKANAFMGRGNYFDTYTEYNRPTDEAGAYPRELGIKSTGNLGYSLCLMVMPFSFDWSKEWN